MAEKIVRPFTSGLQDAVWQDRNCVSCKLWNNDPDQQKFECNIDEALLVACFGDGTIPLGIAVEAGWTEAGGWPSECKKKVEVE